MASTETPRNKITLVGDARVGKTSMVTAVTNNTFTETYTPTLREIVSSATMLIEGEPLTVTLWDTTGDENYDRLRPLAYPDTQVCLICFSLDSPLSLSNVLAKWHPEVCYHCPNAKIILVGTKMDLRVAGSSVDQGYYQPEQVAKDIGAKAYLTCSARTEHGLLAVFRTAAELVLNKQLL
ncbi:small GTP binding protein RAC1 [Pelomyxa schiedti]|nr:small GTP binding protein RAC1 [Pelomyxa schiedti]